jgi:hypothetical protein
MGYIPGSEGYIPQFLQGTIVLCTVVAAAELDGRDSVRGGGSVFTYPQIRKTAKGRWHVWDTKCQILRFTNLIAGAKKKEWKIRKCAIHKSQLRKSGTPYCKNRAFQRETRHDQDKRLDQENKMIRIAQDCGRHGHSVYRKQLIKQQKQSKHTALSSTHILLHLPPQQS